MLKRIKENTYRLLIYTQRFTNVDNIYLAKNGVWAYGYYTTSIILGAIASITFARLSSPAIYGYYQYIAGITSTVAFLSLPGINTSILQAVAKGSDNSLFVGLKTRLRYSFLSVLVLCGISAYYFFVGKNDLMARLVLIGAVFFPTTYAFNCLFTFFNAKKKFFKFYLFEFLMNLINTASVVLAVFFLKNILWIVFLNFFSYSLFNLALYYFIKKHEPHNQLTDPEVIPYGKKLTLIGLVPQILGSSDLVVIPHFLGVDSLAVYIIAVKIPNALKNLLISINTVIFPRLVDVKSSSLAKKLANIWIVLAFLFLLVVIIVCLPFAIKLLFGNTYLSAIYPAQIYTLGIIPIFLTKIISDWSLANRKAMFYFKNSVFTDVGNLILTVAALMFFHSLLALVAAKVLINILAFLYALVLLITAKNDPQRV